MNTQLVNTLVQTIQSLSQEERALLEEKLNKPQDWRSAWQQVREVRSAINARRGGKPFDPPPEEIIRKMREERDEQLMNACFPELFAAESATEA